MGLTIDQLQLSQNARRAAQLVLAAHPDVQFTSGRRDGRAQAHAMAVNTLRYGAGWLDQTYKNKQMVAELAQWLASNQDHARSVNVCADAFYEILLASQSGHLAQFPHCRGDAFDIGCPRTQDSIDEAEVQRIRGTIERLPVELGLQLIVTKEGALRVIHAQFAHALEVVQV